jgi:hypothetical protein
MKLKDTTAIECARSIARAQSSLNRRDAREFRAAIRDLQKHVEKNGRWQSAVNFLARSIDSAPVSTSMLAGSQ